MISVLPLSVKGGVVLGKSWAFRNSSLLPGQTGAKPLWYTYSICGGSTSRLFRKVLNLSLLTC